MKLAPIGSTCGCYYDTETNHAHICRMHYNQLMNDSDIKSMIDMECDLETEPSTLSEIFGIPIIITGDKDVS